MTNFVIMVRTRKVRSGERISEMNHQLEVLSGVCIRNDLITVICSALTYCPQSWLSGQISGDSGAWTRLRFHTKTIIFQEYQIEANSKWSINTERDIALQHLVRRTVILILSNFWPKMSVFAQFCFNFIIVSV